MVLLVRLFVLEIPHVCTVEKEKMCVLSVVCGSRACIANDSSIVLLLLLLLLLLCISLLQEQILIYISDLTLFIMSVCLFVCSFVCVV